MANEVLGSKRDINALLRSAPDARLLQGWRYNVIGKELVEELAD